MLQSRLTTMQTLLDNAEGFMSIVDTTDDLYKQHRRSYIHGAIMTMIMIPCGCRPVVLANLKNKHVRNATHDTISNTYTLIVPKHKTDRHYSGQEIHLPEIHIPVIHILVKFLCLA